MQPTRPNLYLDVDGVLLGKNDPASPKVVLAHHAKEFLTFALDNFNCYWLTTHCKGAPQPVLRYLAPYLTPDLEALLIQVRPTRWETLKTEALQGEFYWIDDSPLAIELKRLKEMGRLDRWIQVDTRRRPDDLLVAMERLKNVIKQGRG